jgi:hypothetical protein
VAQAQAELQPGEDFLLLVEIVVLAQLELLVDLMAVVHNLVLVRVAATNHFMKAGFQEAAAGAEHIVVQMEMAQVAAEEDSAMAVMQVVALPHPLELVLVVVEETLVSTEGLVGLLLD